MNDMRHAIVPKSDQLNADDLIAGPMTIAVREVTIRGGQEQPVSIHFDNDGGKPYKPCKSMSRVLVAAWGADANKYVGRSLTLYRDPTVKWAGMEVGGIRISHMSHIERDMVMALTATKGQRKPFMVKPLAETKPNTAQTQSHAKPEFEIVTGDGEVRTFDKAGDYLAGLREAFDVLGTDQREAWWAKHAEAFNELHMKVVQSGKNKTAIAAFDDLSKHVNSSLAAAAQPQPE